MKEKEGEEEEDEEEKGKEGNAGRVTTDKKRNTKVRQGKECGRGE